MLKNISGEIEMPKHTIERIRDVVETYGDIGVDQIAEILELPLHKVRKDYRKYKKRLKE